MNRKQLLKEYGIIPWRGNCERALLWANELETTKFKQCMKVLSRGDSRCCLGVVYDLFAEKVKGKWRSSGDDYYFITRSSCDSKMLPKPVQRLLSTDLNPIILLLKNSDYVTKRMSGLNDDLGMTFKQIAWVIRESVRLAGLKDDNIT